MLKDKIPENITKENALGRAGRGGAVNLDGIGGKAAERLTKKANEIARLKGSEKPQLASNILLDEKRMRNVVKVLKDAFPNAKADYDLNLSLIAKLGRALERMRNGDFSGNTPKVVVDSITALNSVFYDMNGDLYIADKVKADAAEIVRQLYRNRDLVGRMRHAVSDEKTRELARYAAQLLREVAVELRADIE